jgi:vitamin B12 transporter
MRSHIRLIALLTLFSPSAVNLNAQTSVGSVLGIVVDSSGASINGARVVLLYANKLAMRETMTNERGEFSFLEVRAGDYSVSVEAEGLTQGGGAQPVKIVGGQQMRLAIPMTVAGIEDSVVVSATRTESRVSEISDGAYTVAASDLLRDQRITASDALRASPGVTIMQTARRGGVTSLFVRGGESDYTKILIDGVPVNDAGGTFDFADLTTDNAERIELVRTAQSALYGSDAMSGVLQLFTRRGTTYTPEWEFSTEGGSFGFSRQFTRFAGNSRMIDYSASYGYLRTKGRDVNDDYQNRISTVNLGFRPGVRTQLRLTGRTDNSGLGVPGPTAFLFPDPDERAERKRYVAGARLDDQTTNFWHQSFSFAYSDGKASNFDPLAQDLTIPGTPADHGTAFNDFVLLFDNHQRRRGLRYQSDFILPGGNLFTAGADYEQERAVFDSGFAGTNRVQAERRNIGVFLQDQFNWGPRLYVVGGLRWENNRAKSVMGFTDVLSTLGSSPFNGDWGYGSEIVPRIAAIYVLRLSGLQSGQGPTRLKFNYGEGIKSPSMVEAISPNPFFLGNPDLKPEKSRNFDIGLEQFFLKDRVRFEGFYFDNRFRNQIALVSDPATRGGPITLPDGRLTNFINFNRARARGMELSLTWNPKQSIQFGGSYTLLDTKLEEAADVFDFSSTTNVTNPEVGLPLLRRPRNSGSFYFNWMSRKMDLNLIGYILGKRRDRDPVTTSLFDAQGLPIFNSGYSRVDLTSSYRPSQWVGIFWRIENLLNKNYQEVLGYPAYRLTFSAGMRFKVGGSNKQ